MIQATAKELAAETVDTIPVEHRINGKMVEVHQIRLNGFVVDLVECPDRAKEVVRDMRNALADFIEEQRAEIKRPAGNRRIDAS